MVLPSGNGLAILRWVRYQPWPRKYGWSGSHASVALKQCGKVAGCHWSSSSTRQAPQIPSIGPLRNCHPASSRVADTAAPLGDCDCIAAARSGGRSRMPVVAIDAVSKNCLLEEISNKGLWSDAVTLARRLGNIGPADRSPLNRGVSVTNGHSNQALYGSRLTLCFHGSGWQVTHRLVFMLLLSGMECVRWELISGCV